MGLEFKLNICDTGSDSYPRFATVITVSEIIKAIEDAIAPYGLGIYSMKQDRTVTFPIIKENRNG